MGNIEFIPPAFLKNQSTEEIHSKMMSTIPDKWDKSEGQFPWEYTRPTAIEKSEMVEFVLMEAIKTIFPMWSEGQMLVYHATCRGLIPKMAKSAVGTVEVTAIAKTVIPKGFKFLTPATYDKAGVVFETSYEVEVSENTVTIPITAQVAGTSGNVAVGTITLMDTPIEGILMITNSEATSGGVDAETDDELQERIANYDQEQGVSFVGSLSDYKRWAGEVEGVGQAKPYQAEDDSGKVIIIIVDSNDNPATEQLCQSVYNYIMRPDSPTERLAPVNAVVEIKSPTVVDAVIATTGLRLAEGYTQEQVRASYLRGLKEYQDTPDATVKILYDKVAGILIQTEGVLEYYGLTMNGTSENITLTSGEMAVFDVTGVVISS